MDGMDTRAPDMLESSPMAKPVIEIEFCSLSNWILRAVYMANELLRTFDMELGRVTLVPTHEGDFFEVRLDGGVLWSRDKWQGFPHVNELILLVRDRIAPAKELDQVDHSD